MAVRLGKLFELDNLENSVEAFGKTITLTQLIQESKILGLGANISRIAGFVKPLAESPEASLILGISEAVVPFAKLTKALFEYIQKQNEPNSFTECAILTCFWAYLDNIREYGRHLKFSQKSSDKILKPEKFKSIREIEISEIEAENALSDFAASTLSKIFQKKIVTRLCEYNISLNEAVLLTEKARWATQRKILKFWNDLPEDNRLFGQISLSDWQQEKNNTKNIERYLEIHIQKPLTIATLEGTEPSLLLNELYVPLEIKEEIYSQDNVIEEEYLNVNSRIRDNLFNESKKVIFIEGHSGQGKTALCKILANEVSLEIYPAYIPILIDFQDIKSIRDTLQETLNTCPSLSRNNFFRANKDWLTDSKRRFLVILDGIDELIVDNIENANELVYEIIDFINEGENKFIITGRDVYSKFLSDPYIEKNNIALIKLQPMSQSLKFNWIDKWSRSIIIKNKNAESKSISLREISTLETTFSSNLYFLLLFSSLYSVFHHFIKDNTSNIQESSLEEINSITNTTEIQLSEFLSESIHQQLAKLLGLRKFSELEKDLTIQFERYIENDSLDSSELTKSVVLEIGVKDTLSCLGLSFLNECVDSKKTKIAEDYRLIIGDLTRQEKVINQAIESIDIHDRLKNKLGEGEVTHALIDEFKELILNKFKFIFSDFSFILNHYFTLKSKKSELSDYDFSELCYLLVLKFNLAEKFKSFIRENCPKDIEEDFSSDPLSLYLLASLYRSDDTIANKLAQIEEYEARSIIYQNTIDSIFNRLNRKRSWYKYRKNLKLTDEDLKLVLRHIGQTIVQTGRLSIEILKVKKSLESENRESIKKFESFNFEDLFKHLISKFNILLFSENSVEFSHRSFSEFLFAEYIYTQFLSWVKTLEDDSFRVNNKSLEESLYSLLGYGLLSPEIINYVKATFDKTSTKNLISLFERLNTYYFSWCSGNQFEYDTSSSSNLKPWHIFQRKSTYLERRFNLQHADLYVGANVLLILTEIHRYASNKGLSPQIEFYPCGLLENEHRKYRENLSRFLGYSRCLSIGSHSDLSSQNLIQNIGQYFYELNLVEAHLKGANLNGFNLSNANLSNADLSRVNFGDAKPQAANLIGANLSSSILILSNLSHAKVKDADFHGANLGGANLSGLDFNSVYSVSGAIFTGANLTGSILKGVDLSKANLSGLDLSRFNLENTDLSDANLSNTNLIGLDFSKVRSVSGAIFTGANLTGSILKGVDLSKANLSGLDLSRFNLENTDLSDANLSNTNLIGLDFSKVRSVSGAIFTGANLTGSILKGVDLSKANLSGLDLHEFDLESTDFSQANLRSTYLAGAVLKNAIFREVDLSDQDLRTTDLSGADFTDAKLIATENNEELGTIKIINIILLQGANLGNSILSDQNLSDINLSDVNLKGADLSGCVLSGQVLREFDLSDADLQDANLTNCDLYLSNLSDCDLSDAIFSNANLQSARLVKSSCLRTDFSQANLENADLNGADVSDANFEGANLSNTILESY